LQAAPRDLESPIVGSGGIAEWIHKGVQNPTANLEAVVDSPAGTTPLRHCIEFGDLFSWFEVYGESIEDEHAGNEAAGANTYYRFRDGIPILKVSETMQELERKDFETD